MELYRRRIPLDVTVGGAAAVLPQATLGPDEALEIESRGHGGGSGVGRGELGGEGAETLAASGSREGEARGLVVGSGSSPEPTCQLMNLHGC